MKIVSHGATHAGRVRENNEDAFLVDEELGLYAVSDGVGGHAAGEVASRTCLTTIHAALTQRAEEITALWGSFSGSAKVTALLVDAVQRASSTVYRLAQSTPEKHGMGATLSLLLFGKKKAIMAHVGDSRLYLRRGNAVHQLSADHTWANELLRSGVITDAEAREHRMSNVLTRAIGQQPVVEVDTTLIDFAVDDTFLLCSDGLSNELRESLDTGGSELIGFLGREKLKAVPGELIALANARGGKDNITALVIRVRPDSDDQALEFERRDDLRLALQTMERSPLFQGLSYRELARIAGYARLAHVDADEPLVSRANAKNKLWLLLQGGLQIHGVEDSKRSVVPGASLSAMTLFSPVIDDTEIVATQHSRVFTLSAGNFATLLEKKPKIAAKVMLNLLQHLAATTPGSDALVIDPLDLTRASFADGDAGDSSGNGDRDD